MRVGSTSVTVGGLKVGQKAPAGCCYARTIDQPGFYLYICERELSWGMEEEL